MSTSIPINPPPESRPRVILHLDLDAFFCSVELLEKPELKGKPVVVGGRSEQRGVVAAASYPAREYGIHSAMSMYQAQKLCPELIILPPRFKAYQTYSRIVMGLLRNETPLMEQMSVDEAYLDLTGQVPDWDAAVAVARSLQRRIQRDIGLSSSLGLATSKMVAKIASDFEKPAGFTIVKPGTEKTFLAPLPVDKIPGIGPKTVLKLAGLNVTKVADLAALDQRVLRVHFGKWGPLMAQWAQGRDERRVVTGHETKSVSHERTFSEDIRDRETLSGVLERLSGMVARQLKKENLQARTVSIKIRYADFTTLSRQTSLAIPVDSAGEIYQVALKLFRKEPADFRALRLLGVGCSNLSGSGGQLSLEW